MSKFKLGAWFHRAGKLLRGRTFTAAGLAVAVGLSLWAVAENVKILYIADGAETGVTLALRSDPTEQALSRAGITLKENDTVTTRETALVYSRVSISRGVSVTLVADGRETPAGARSCWSRTASRWGKTTIAIRNFPPCWRMAMSLPCGGWKRR